MNYFTEQHTTFFLSVPPSTKPPKQSYWLYVYWTAAWPWLRKQPPRICLSCWWYEYPIWQSLTKQTLTTLSFYNLVQVINKPTHRCGHIIDRVIVRPDDDIHSISTVTDSFESDHYCTKSYFNVTVSMPSTLYRTVRSMANIDRSSFIAELCSVTVFSSVENANQFCDFLRTVLDKHAPPSLRKVTTHSSSPLFESIRDELFIDMWERRQA